MQYKVALGFDMGSEFHIFGAQVHTHFLDDEPCNLRFRLLLRLFGLSFSFVIHNSKHDIPYEYMFIE